MLTGVLPLHARVILPRERKILVLFFQSLDLKGTLVTGGMRGIRG